MKLLILVFLVMGVVACSNAKKGFFGAEPVSQPNVLNSVSVYKGIPIHKRLRRQERGSISIQGTKPLSGPDRKPTLDIDYNHRIFGDDRRHLDTFGGANMRPGQINPHAGLKFEKEFRNGHVGAFGQVQKGSHGRPDPSFGIRGGFRF